MAQEEKVVFDDTVTLILDGRVSDEPDWWAEAIAIELIIGAALLGVLVGG